jgi:hypothetical protein
MKKLESFENFSECALENAESIQITGGTLWETGCCSDGKTPGDLFDDATGTTITIQCP